MEEMGLSGFFHKTYIWLRKTEPWAEPYRWGMCLLEVRVLALGYLPWVPRKPILLCPLYVTKTCSWPELFQL